MRLHLGCGDKYLPGFKHVDARPATHVDFVSDVSQLSFIEDGSCDEIYACHVLEHFGRLKYQPVIEEWSRVLKKGGLLRVSVPDFDAIVEEYRQNKNLQSVLGLLYGGQTYEQNYHYMAFNFETLSDVLKKNRFSRIEKYNWRDFLPENYDDFSKAYLPHLDFVNGRQMSLNVVAWKE